MGGKPPCCSSVRNDVDVQFRCELNQPFRQRGLPKQDAVGSLSTAQHNLGHAGQPGKFGDLVGHVIAIYRLDGCTQLLSQTQIGPQTVPIRLRYGLKIFCLNKQRRKAAAERVGHPGSRSDDTFIGRCCGKANQDMLPGPVPLSAPAFLCIQSRPVRAAAKGKLPKRAQFGL